MQRWIKSTYMQHTCTGSSSGAWRQREIELRQQSAECRAAFSDFHRAQLQQLPAGWNCQFYGYTWDTQKNTRIIVYFLMLCIRYHNIINALLNRIGSRTRKQEWILLLGPLKFLLNIYRTFQNGKSAFDSLPPASTTTTRALSWEMSLRKFDK